jgi:hypothetical protein
LTALARSAGEQHVLRRRPVRIGVADDLEAAAFELAQHR